MVLVAVTWSVGALAWRSACLFFGGGPRCVLSYSIHGPSIHTSLRLRRRVRTLAPSSYLALFSASVCVHTTSRSSCALRLVACMFCDGGVLSGGLWFPPLVFVRVFLIPCLFPCGQLIKYSLIPPMLRSAVLAASCSSCFLGLVVCIFCGLRWRAVPSSLWCACHSAFPSALTAYKEGEESGSRGGVTWFGGALAWRFACVPFSGCTCCVLSYIHTLCPFPLGVVFRTTKSHRVLYLQYPSTQTALHQ